MKLLQEYTNGNVLIKIYDNGTRVQEWDEIPEYTLPISMDIKITNYCDRSPLCKFCHEQSSLTGKHADLEFLFNIIKDLNPGTEIALGGGNPLTHPKLEWFLQQCKTKGLIPNMTINSDVLNNSYYVNFLNYLIKAELIYGLGISISDDFDFNLINMIDKLKNVVYHVIAGVNDISILDKINQSPVKKVLILGYKQFGRGLKYYSNSVQNCLNDWNLNIGNYIRKIHLSFDNLALKQLDIKNYLSEKEWENFYQGNDGLCTMYIDAVKQEIGLSSVAETRFPMDRDIESLFNLIKISG